MIKLDDFTAEDLVNVSLDYRCGRKKIDGIYELYSLLRKNGLENASAADLKRIRELLPLLDRKIEDAEKRIANANEKGKHPQIYTFETLKEAKVDDETISKTDKFNKGDVLLFRNPARLYSIKHNRLSMLTVEEIKNRLGRFDLGKLDNAFVASVRDFGHSSIPKLVNSINAYDKQLARVYRETGNRSRGVNLLEVDKKEKQEIVRDNIREMTELLIDSGTEYVWGELSDADKFKMYKAVTGSRSYESLKIYEYLLNMFANYTTLNQLKQGATKPKTLRKLIVK